MRVSVLDFVFFFKQKTAYEMRISDWSSDVCSSDLGSTTRTRTGAVPAARMPSCSAAPLLRSMMRPRAKGPRSLTRTRIVRPVWSEVTRSEEHTSELQSLMRISYAVFCLKKKKYILSQQHTNNRHT